MEESSFLPKSFETFLKQNIQGFNQFKCKAAYLPNFGGCLVSNNHVKEGEELLRIPQSLFITLTVATKMFPILLDVKKSLNVQRKSILAFFLHSQKNDKNSLYYEYLNAIPTTYSNTITWTDTDFDLLRDELKTKHKKKQQKILSEFESIKSFISKQQDDLLKYDTLDEPQFLQLTAMIESRTLFFKNEQDPTSDVGAMIPFYDLANHTFMEGVDHFKYFYFDQQNNEYVMRAYKDFQPDEQIFITYGNYNNEHFLDYYGFIPFNNSREALQFTIQTNQLQQILGKEFTKKLNENIQVAQQILNHFFTDQKLKPSIILEIEEFTQQFSWETITFLQVFSLNLDTKSLPSSAPPTKNKQQYNYIPDKQKQSHSKADKNSKQMKSASEKSQLTQILEAFNSNQIESQIYYNEQLYKLFASNLKKYLLSLYSNIKLDKISSSCKETSYTTLLAKEYTEKEINIINQCNI